MKLGFCFLIYDTIHHEELWHHFFAVAPPEQFGIYIHYKTQKSLQYFEQYKLATCIPTHYCDVSIVHAHNLLFRAAYQDGCDKIISLSQACIPLKSFFHVYTFLTANAKGHFNVTPQSHCFPRTNSLLEFYRPEVIQKSSNWFILNRTLCQAVLAYSKADIDKHYAPIFTPEEHFFITTIYDRNLQNEIIITPNEAEQATTFTNWAPSSWPGMHYKYPSQHKLKNYSEIAADELDYLITSACLFGRKFNPECAPFLARLKLEYTR